jgi:hypothetical protein
LNTISSNREKQNEMRGRGVGIMGRGSFEKQRDLQGLAGSFFLKKKITPQPPDEDPAVVLRVFIVFTVVGLHKIHAFPTKWLIGLIPSTVH